MGLLRWFEPSISEKPGNLNTAREKLKKIEKLDKVGWRWRGKGFTPADAKLALEVELQPCGKCGSQSALLVYLDYHADPSGKAATQELFCEACNLYSTYSGYD